MIKGKFKITKVVFKKEGFNIYGAEPLKLTEGEVQLNKYNNITLQTPMEFTTKHEYTLTLEEGHDKYGVYYSVISTGFDFQSLDEITPELHLDLLKELTSPDLAENIHNAYPNFIQLMLEHRENEVDVRKIYGVGEKLLAKYAKKVRDKCTSYMLMASFPKLKLTQLECNELLKKYHTVENIKAEIANDPYNTMIHNTKRRFSNIDKLFREDCRFNSSRIIRMMEEVIWDITYEGSTYISTQTLVDNVSSYDREVVPYLLQAIKENDLIRYDEDKDMIQTKEVYELEHRVGDFIKEKLNQHRPLDWDWEMFTEVKDGVLTEEQQGALKMVCENSLSVLVGSSGCGKTSSVKAIIIMLEAYHQDYLLLSPTGKAAQRLSQQTGREASTIHRAAQDKRIFTDWIIIDEMSMVSLDVFEMVIKAVKDSPHTRFLFIGDSGQLPSIGIGSILRDCIESQIVPVTTLTHCFRFKEGGASYVGECMRQGKQYLPNDVKDFYTMGANKDYTFIQWNGTREQIVNTYMQAIQSGILVQDICLLIPYNKGECGTIKINNDIQNLINPIKKYDKTMKTKINDTQVIFHTGDMVLITKNNYSTIRWVDYDNEIFDGGDMNDAKEKAKGVVYNGQVGIVTNMVDDGMVVNIEGQSFVLAIEDLNHLRLGYAISVHKAQGSEAPYVINVVIPPHARMLSRELCYTAQTRFSKKLIEIGDVRAINYALGVGEQDERKTRLKEFLLDE